jgi:hypothetical protein
VPEKRIVFVEQITRSSATLSAPLISSPSPKVFLLSPANAAGIRGKLLFNPTAQFDLARRLSTGAPLGEVYSFISGLYFRGKLAYAQRFADSSRDVAPVHIITASAGLLPPDTLITLSALQTISFTSVDEKNHHYRQPLVRDAISLRAHLSPETQVVLLGSIATPKYVEPLLEVFGDRLMFPKDFVGRGDMSRGGLLLRCCLSGSPLEYMPVAGAIRHGQRPAKLTPSPNPAKPKQKRRRKPQ